MRYLTIEQRESLDKTLKARAVVLVAEVSAALRQKDTPETIHLANRFEEVGENALADLEVALDVASIERDIAELRRVVAARRCIACQRVTEHASAGGAHPSL